jgi:putative DNA primase/helicase
MSVTPTQPVALTASQTTLLSYPLTDSGQGERIIALFGQDLRYCIEMRKWLVWDGRRWEIDQRGAASQLAKHAARLLHDQAPQVTAIRNFARTSESDARIRAALKRASTEEGIYISAVELDQNPYSMNCWNGTVDLRNGELLPHDRQAMITKVCPIAYDPAASCPLFLKFLHWAMGGSPDGEICSQAAARMVGYLQRAFGYALTADVSERAVFVFWGEKGNNGKTTLLSTFQALLGPYAAQLSVDNLTTISRDAALRADLADLRGARFVISSEIEQDHRLSEGKLKYLTAGTGSIKSCRKYENPIEFPATHKLFVDCNYRPTVRGVDDAIWGRLKLIPFAVSVKEEDLDRRLLDKLLTEARGILAWAVRGCTAWITEGLGDPPEIGQAGLEWRQHDDPLQDFLQDRCHSEAGLWVSTSALTAAYLSWCVENRERFPLGRVQFAERIRGAGYKLSRSRRSGGHQLRTWEGLTLSGTQGR